MSDEMLEASAPPAQPSARVPNDAWHVELHDEAATFDLARQIAELVRAEDLVTLSGDLGAGKTTFARALLRRLAQDPDLDVPSPTFTLMQVYETPAFPVVHADLYRIKSPDELAELGWDEASLGALVLVEWPDRAGTILPPDRLDIAFHLDPDRGPGYRIAVLRGQGTFAARLNRSRAIAEVLKRSGWGDARREFMMGDASTRAYERLKKPEGSTAVLMIMPPRPPGPIIRFGKPYPAIARLALDIKPFIAMDLALRSEGFSAPEIYASDQNEGLAVLEDLGSVGVVDASGFMPERYQAAISVLAALHIRPLPEFVPLPGTGTYRIPLYDFEALLIEVEQMLDWYAPHVAKITLSSSSRATLLSLWRRVLDEVIIARPAWVLRDFHSPNLIWLPERPGVAKVGLVDFQDCVLGHPAYDVASLLQDARTTIPENEELKLLIHYAKLRREADPAFDMAAFARAYAIMGAQRNTKILGIFARLDKRDKKPAYLGHLPRIARYLAKDLAHPALAEIRAWHAANLPQVFGTPA